MSVADDRRESEGVCFIGVAKSGWTLDQLRERARDSVEKHGGVEKEPAVFRIDHYLGKEPVQNLLLFRFANTEVVQPILGGATPVHEYEPGTWGPSEADALVAGVGGWHSPVRASG